MKEGTLSRRRVEKNVRSLGISNAKCFDFFLFEKQRKNISSLGPDKIFQISGLSTRFSKLEETLSDMVVKNAFYVSGGALCLIFS